MKQQFAAKHPWTILGKTVNFVWTAKASHFGGGGIAQR